MSRRPHQGTRVSYAAGVRYVVLFALPLILASCGSCGPDEPDGLPEQAVHRLFDAVHAHDCATVRAELGGRVGRQFDEAGCDEVLETLGGATVDRIEPSEVDGRDPELHLVPVWFEGMGQPKIVHVRAEDGKWKVVSL